MDNPYALTDTPNNAQTDVPQTVTDDVSDNTLEALTVDPVGRIVRVPPEDLTDNQALTHLDIPVDNDSGELPPSYLEVGYTDASSPDITTPDEIALPPDLDALTNTQPVEPDTVATDETAALLSTGDSFQEIPPDLDLASNLPVASSLSIDPDLDEGGVIDDGEAPDDLEDPTNRAAEATMNISLAALGDTIRQQIEARQQEIDTRLSLLYAQRAELTERIAATGDNAPQGT